MQFGHVLAFSTLVLASPTPSRLEDRGATFSISGLAADVSSAASNIAVFNDILNGNEIAIATALAGVAATIPVLSDTASSAAKSALQTIGGTVTSSGKIIYSDIQQTIANLTQLALTLNATITAAASTSLTDVQTDVNNLVANIKQLVTALAFTPLTGLLTVTVTSSNNALKTFGQEVKALQALVNPFVTALKGLQATLSASIGSDAPSVGSYVAAALVTFVNQVQQNIPTITQ